MLKITTVNIEYFVYKIFNILRVIIKAIIENNI
jgi:hypothetical protein